MATVFVGLSGGVDSAVSAALLQQQGYGVVGVYIKIWSPEFLECTWRQDRLDAKRVAAALGIPFVEIDMSEQYRAHVVGDMLQNYQSGITPNPDVLCNTHIKFGAFFEWALRAGADFVATGHYAQNCIDSAGSHLLCATDSTKDQSYFLYQVTQQHLAKTLFPIGHMLKIDVRKKAIALALPVARKADSQGLCFVGDVTMKDFLARFISLREGELLDETGRHIGTHDGVALYTLGQRHGFTLAGAAGQGPYYVTEIDAQRNIVHVARDRKRSYSTQATISNVHWITRPIDTDSAFDGVARYHAKRVETYLYEGDTPRVVLKSPELLSPGQSLVLYRGAECFGGAVMRSVHA